MTQMTPIAKHLASQGRNGDTILAHINPYEAQVLRAMGGSGGINPNTGLPEFGWLSDLWSGFKKVVKVAAPFILPAVALFVPTLPLTIGTYLGLSGTAAIAAGSAALSAGVAAASGANLSQVLTSAALGGLTPVIAPVIGSSVSSLIPGGLSAATQNIVTSGLLAGGLTAARGGSIKQILTSAATGAAASYITGIAANAIKSINANYPPTANGVSINQKGLDDASFVAADAAQLKAAGLGQNQIAQVLEASGVSPTIAVTAAQGVMSGTNAVDLAVGLASRSPTGIYASGQSGNTQSVSLGNETAIKALQTSEDAAFIAQDAAALAKQGLSASQIEFTLKESGVSPDVAKAVATNAARGYTADYLASQLYKTPTNLDSSVDALEKSPISVVKNTDTSGFVPSATQGSGDYAADVAFAAEDAYRLKMQGLSLTQIKDTLDASGVASSMAYKIADLTTYGYNPDQVTQYLKTYPNYGKVYDTTAPVKPVTPTPTPETPVVEQPTTPTPETPVVEQPTTPTTPVVEQPTTPPVVEQPTTPVSPTTPADNTTTQVFDDGSQLVTDNTTGQVVSATDTTGTPIAINPPASTAVRTERQWAPRGPGEGTTTFYPDGTMRYVGDDGSIFTKGTTGGWTQIAEPTVVTPPTTPTPTPAQPTPAPVEPAPPSTTPTTPPVTEVTPPTTPTTPAPGVPDVSTNIQFFDDGSVLVTDSSGAVIGKIDATGVSPTLDLQIFDDGSVLITDSQGEPLGGVDNTGDVFHINNTGVAVYSNGARLDLGQLNAPSQTTPPPEGTPEIDINGTGQVPPPVTPPVTPPTDGGYGTGFPENIDISGSNPPPVTPEPPVIPPVVTPEPPIDDIVHSDTEKPVDPETPTEPPVVPPVIPPVVTPTPTPTKPAPGTYVPAAPDPRYLGKLPLPGLNPGWMEEGVRPMYATTSPVQSQYYWGNQRGFTDLADLQANYNRINNIQPPWGVHQGWWEQPMVNPNTYNANMVTQPVAPQGALPGYYGTPNVDYTRIAQNYVPVVPTLTPIDQYRLSRGQYYDANGNPVAG